MTKIRAYLYQLNHHSSQLKYGSKTKQEKLQKSKHFSTSVFYELPRLDTYCTYREAIIKHNIISLPYRFILSARKRQNE